jgi:hypothetical protein
MLWADSLKHLIHTVGWDGNSRMTEITWKYAIRQAFQLSQIHYVPGNYNGRLSHAYILLIRYDNERHPTVGLTPDLGRQAIERRLPSTTLGFELPFKKFNLQPDLPPYIKHTFHQFISKTTPIYASQDPQNEKQLENLAQSVLDKLNLCESWDALVIATALTICRVKPLPMYKYGLREREWGLLTTQRRSASGDLHINNFGNIGDFCLSFIVTAMVKRYPMFQQAPHLARVVLWERRWGNPAVSL